MAIDEQQAKAGTDIPIPENKATDQPEQPAATLPPAQSVLTSDGFMPEHVRAENSWAEAMKVFPENAGIVADANKE